MLTDTGLDIRQSPIIELRRVTERSSEQDQLATAVAMTHHIVREWWSLTASRVGVDKPVRAPFNEIEPGRIPPDSVPVLDAIAKTLSIQDTELATYAIGQLYTALVPESYRARNGMFFTPQPLTSRLLDIASQAGVNWATARVLDPACGGGAFLAPVARRILASAADTNPEAQLQSIGSCLRGYEIDPLVGWLSQVALDAVVLQLTAETGQQLPVVVDIGDSLERAEQASDFDLVVGNPPYGRVRLTQAQRSAWSRSLYGHANLYGLFTDLAVRLTKPGGVISLVLPTGFVAGEYFKHLRVLLHTEAPPVSVDFVGARKDVFDGVLQEALLFTAVKAPKRRRQVAVTALSMPTATHQPRIERLGRVPLQNDASAPWILPREKPQVEWVRALSQQPCTLTDWGYSISTGPLVWNRKKDQLARRKARDCVPLIWAESVTADGNFRWPGRKPRHSPYFQLRKRDDWLVIDEPCVLVQRTTAKEQRRRLIAACLDQDFLDANGGRVVVENHLNMVKAIPGSDPVPAKVVAAFLNSEAADLAFRCLSGTVAVSAYELQSLPLPDPSALKRVAKGARTSEAFEAACKKLYLEGA